MEMISISEISRDCIRTSNGDDAVRRTVLRGRRDELEASWKEGRFSGNSCRKAGVCLRQKVIIQNKKRDLACRDSHICEEFHHLFELDIIYTYRYFLTFGLLNFKLNLIYHIPELRAGAQGR